jgi:hypothetical protein
MFQGREKDLERYFAFQDNSEVIEHDHLVRLSGDQFEEPKRGKMPTLIYVGLSDFVVQNRSHRECLGGSRSSEEIKACSVLPGDAADVVPDYTLSPV